MENPASAAPRRTTLPQSKAQASARQVLVAANFRLSVVISLGPASCSFRPAGSKRIDRSTPPIRTVGPSLPDSEVNVPCSCGALLASVATTLHTKTCFAARARKTDRRTAHQRQRYPDHPSKICDGDFLTLLRCDRHITVTAKRKLMLSTKPAMASAVRRSAICMVELRLCKVRFHVLDPPRRSLQVGRFRPANEEHALVVSLVPVLILHLEGSRTAGKRSEVALGRGGLAVLLRVLAHRPLLSIPSEARSSACLPAPTRSTHGRCRAAHRPALRTRGSSNAALRCAGPVGCFCPPGLFAVERHGTAPAGSLRFRRRRHSFMACQAAV